MPCLRCCGLFPVQTASRSNVIGDPPLNDDGDAPNDLPPPPPPRRNDADDEPNEDPRDGPAAAAAAAPADATAGVVDLGTDLVLHLGPLLSGEGEPHSIPDLRRAMMMAASEDSSTRLAHLTVHFESDVRTARPDDQGLVPFLLQYVRTSQNRHLRKLTLSCLGVFYDSLFDVCRQFLVAAAQSETIQHLCLDSFRAFPVQDMVGFCRANRNIKVLQVDFAGFHSDEIPARARQAWEDVAGPEGSTIAVLDKLVLDNIEFEDEQAVHTFFYELVPRLKCSELSLGRVTCLYFGALERVALGPIISWLMQPPVKRLELQGGCNPVVIVKALAAGLTTLEELSVEFSPTWRNMDGPGNVTIFMQAFPHFTKLKVLQVILTIGDLEVEPNVKKEFFRAVDASVTLTRVQVFDAMEINFNRDEMRLLSGGRTQRNRELSHFAAAPDTYPARGILKLMLQLNNCPTGRFQLVRNLPKEYFRGKQS